MEYTLYELSGLFLIYSFLGWCAEVAFVAVNRGIVVNRGFLNGPVCPIYGVGMLGVLLLLGPIAEHIVLLFLGGMILCSLVELIGGWLLERIFEIRWWDYSQRPLNLGGYICLSMSVLWGLAVTFVVHLVHPAIVWVVDWVPYTLGLVLMIVCYALFLADLVVTVVTIAGIKRRVRELERVASALHTVGDAISDRLGNTALAADAKLDEFKETSQEKVAQQREKVTAALETSYEKMTVQREKVAAAMESGQEKMAISRQKLEDRVSETLEELQSRRAALEERQRRLTEEYHKHLRFTRRRLGRAFPSIRESIQSRVDRLGKK